MREKCSRSSIKEGKSYVKGRERVQRIVRIKEVGTIKMTETPRLDWFVLNAAAFVYSRQHHSFMMRIWLPPMGFCGAIDRR